MLNTNPRVNVIITVLLNITSLEKILKELQLPWKAHSTNKFELDMSLLFYE